MSDREVLTLAEIGEATGALVHPPMAAAAMSGVAVRGISTDTRSLHPGDLFVALRGPRSDGHRFISDAAARGATGAVVSVLPETPLAIPVLLVPDTLRALGAIAARYRRHLRAKVVGITGSVGKTTVAALTASVLARRFSVVCSQETWNAEIGVPLTLLEATPQTQVIVAEMAMRGPGQIRELVEIAAPLIGLVTNVAESHLGLLGTVEEIAAAKGELIEGLPRDGTAVLNADDPWTELLAARARCPVVRFGFAPGAVVRAEAVAAADRGMRFRLLLGPEAVDVLLPLPGRHSVANALAAAAVGMVLGVSATAVRAALAETAPASRRLQIAEIDGLLLLNDTYNSSPRSVRAALDVLDQVGGARRRVLVLGDMKELGQESARLHREIGREAARRDAALLIAVGPEAEALAQGAREVLAPDRVVHVPDRDAAVAALHGVLRSGDVVLVKGSRAMGLEAVTDALRHHALVAYGGEV